MYESLKQYGNILDCYINCHLIQDPKSLETVQEFKGRGTVRFELVESAKAAIEAYSSKVCPTLSYKSNE